MGGSLRTVKGRELQQNFLFAVLLLLPFSSSPFTCNGNTQVYQRRQLRAMEALWGAWNSSTPDRSRNLAGWSSSQENPCNLHPYGKGNATRNWRGVECLKDIKCTTDTTRNTRCSIVITSLTLNNVSLVGILPSAIGNITTLTTLELTGNPNLTGTLPGRLTEITNLYNIDLHDNDFYGEIPDLRYVENVNLGGNRFNGSIPFPTLRTKDYLVTLNLGRNKFKGIIPKNAFQNLTQLVQLDLSSNRFNGTLPTLSTMRNLQILNLSRNAFTGSVLSSPTVLGLAMDSRLTVLDLSHNLLSSNLNSWNKSELGVLEELYLDNNLINGTLDITHLSALDLLSMKSANSKGVLRVLSLMNNSISSVVYDAKNIEEIATVFRLQGNPYCDSNEGLTTFGQQVCLPLVRANNGKSLKGVIIAVVTSAISLLLLIGLAATVYKHKRYKHYYQLQLQQKFEELEVKPTIFPYNQLRTATRDFHPDTKLGQGAFGAVYKGTLPNGSVLAVKQLFARSTQGIDEFLNEVVLLTGMKHRNLVNLKGCCVREQQRLLVYEYVDNYDVNKALLGPNKALLSWPVRLKICLGVARGLHFLHALAQPKIIHRDIKASNVLLATNYETKIADFGLALLFPDEESYIVTNHVAGTRGYLAPEYASYGQLSDKVDVFSFGVLCLEVVSGRRNIDETVSPDEIYLSKWAWDLLRRDSLMELVDQTMSLQDEEKLEVHRLINIALLCIQNEAEQRPSMERVVAMLQGDSESEAVVAKPGDIEDQYLDSIRLFAEGNSGLATVKEESESSLIDSSRRRGDRSEGDVSTGSVLEFSQVSGRRDQLSCCPVVLRWNADQGNL